jgi:mannosyl-oligosaccharide alpha-1,2-mannosidase
MKFISLALLVAGLLAQQALAAPASNAPYPKRDESASFPMMRSPNSRRGNQDQSQQRADAVKETFQIAWDGYYKYAFPQDELEPLTNQGFNPR